MSTTTVPPVLACLSLADSEAYAARIGLPEIVVHEPASLALLAKLLLHNQTTTPYDTSALHVGKDAWNEPSHPIQLGGGKELMQLGVGNFERIVKRHQGGFCYALNTAFAAFLRSFGFTVSEVGARVYLHRGKDPAEDGFLWSSITHEALIVHWEGGQERYFVDVGFGGGGCPYPIMLKDGETSPSLSPAESFRLVEEVLPVDSTSILEDRAHGFSLYRRVVPPNTKIESHVTADLGPGHWTPCIHFTLTTLSPSDILMASYYNEHAPDAPFKNFFVVSVLLQSGARRTISFGNPPVDMDTKGAQATKRQAKLYSKEGIRGEEFDVEWVDFETGPVRAVLERDFGFKF
ncbi:hypothetical protein RQP46_006002 [Phenoliferia psychrophenolica]